MHDVDSLKMFYDVVNLTLFFPTSALLLLYDVSSRQSFENTRVSFYSFLQLVSCTNLTIPLLSTEIRC